MNPARMSKLEFAMRQNGRDNQTKGTRPGSEYLSGEGWLDLREAALRQG